LGKTVQRIFSPLVGEMAGRPERVFLHIHTTHRRPPRLPERDVASMFTPERALK
jgi:hypothetical protein